MDMSKYKSLFLSDTGDHLNALEGELVELERQQDDTERINEVFRHLHSIKGMASSMGYDEMAVLAHHLEDLMALHREQKSAMGSDEVDLLLKALDLFRGHLRAIEEDRPLEPVPGGMLEEAEQFCGRLQTRGLPVPGSTLQATREPDVAVSLPDGTSAYRIEATVASEGDAPSVRAFLVYRRLGEVGTVTGSAPTVDEMRAGQFDGSRMRFQLATRKGAAEIRRLVNSLAGLKDVEIRLEAQPPGGQPATGRAALQKDDPARQARPTTVRIRTDLLDFFVDSVGELLSLRSYLEELADLLDAPPLREGVRQLGQVVRRLHDRVMEVRMVSVSLLTQRLPRVCRDIAKSRGKKVEFSVDGEEVELDRALVEALDTPLLHLLRNAVDHGIESPEERKAMGKPPLGRIRMKVERDSNHVLLTLSDDGRGIDPREVVRKAREKNLPVPGNATDRPENVFDLLFQPGFSTREGVSDVSGRGVGLDAVKTAIVGLGGRVSIRSEVGQGTSFVIETPLTLAILHVLLVESEGYLLALPASRVLRASSVRAGVVEERNGGQTITLSGNRVPLVDLVGLLRDGEGPWRVEELLTEVVFVGEGQHPLLGLGVERITGHREVVLKGVGSFLRSLGPFGGSTVLGDGRPVLILDVDQVIRRSRI